MGYIAIDCKKCGASLEVDETASIYTCRFCRTAHERDYTSSAAPTPHSLGVMAERAISSSAFGKALQFIEQGLAINPRDANLLNLEEKAKAGLSTIAVDHENQAREEIKSIQNKSEAEQYYLQAQFILHELQEKPEKIDLAFQYIERSLELFPDNPAYLNLKALLLMEITGMTGTKELAVALLEKAAAINPRDIDIQNNLKAAKTSSACFVATAAYGSPLAQEVRALRLWRDEALLPTMLGKLFVRTYYWFSPPLARLISRHPILKQAARWGLTPLVNSVTSYYVRSRI